MAQMSRLVVVAAIALGVLTPAAGAQEDVALGTGLANPTSMALAPDGRIFVNEQTGKVRVIKDGELLDDEFLSLSVTSNNERGLLGITFDPGFATNRFLYVYYTRVSSPVVNRLSSFRASAANPDVVEAGSETVILDNIPSQTGWHNGGAIHFGPDNRLYVAVGEGHASSNAQNLSTLAGKLLRIDANGGIPTDNPFYATTTGAARAIWAYGLRNPFTFDIQPGTGRIFINDVGENAFEEINEAWSGPNTGSNAGFNFGWPDTEGPTDDPDYHTPFYAYPQTSSNGNCALTGGAFYNPATVNFPPQYVGDYFFTDFCNGWVDSIDLTTKNVTRFLPIDRTRDPVDIKVGPDGSLYYLSRENGDPGSVHRVRFTGADEPPSIVSHPDDATVSLGGSATFEVEASGTPPLEYQWQRDGEDIAGATSSSYTLDDAQLADDGAEFRVVITNDVDSVTSDPATLHVTTDLPPTAVIDAPAAGALYSAGETIAYDGSGSRDPEDGDLTHTWRVDFHHELHEHPFMPAAEGEPGGEFPVPTTGHTAADVWYRIHLTVTDEANLTSSTYRDVLPRTAELRLAANLPGIQLRLDGQPHPAPHAAEGVVGIERTLGAASPQTVGGKTYDFVSWSDGGARTHVISTPAADTTYTATFREQAGAAEPPPAGDTPAKPLIPSLGAPLPEARLTLRAPKRMRWRGARRRGIPVRIRGVAGARVRVAIRSGRRRLAARTVRVGAGGERLVRVRLRRGRQDRRRRVRIVVEVALPDGRRLVATRRLWLTPSS